MTTEPTPTITEATQQSCGHIKFLLEYRFLDGALLIDPKTGTTRTAPGLRQLREGKDWLEVSHCPLCGEAIPPNGPDGAEEGGPALEG